MKVVRSISALYNSLLPVHEQLQKVFDQIMLSVRSKKWHYDSRIKSIDSFALKLETGRFSNNSNLEDFFACTIVVENAIEIKTALLKLKSFVKIEYRRPHDDKFTHKNSDSFVFDDLRLYVKLKPTNARRAGPINDLIFEIQIKTFLQHAWLIATHDLIYKSDDINWAKQRVAYQVKAMLENAEVSIQRSFSLRKVSGIPVTNEKVEYQKKIKEFLISNWTKEFLPTNLTRLIENINQLLRVLDISLDVLSADLEQETTQGRGTKMLNLSPYLVIVQTLINQQHTKVGKYLMKNSKVKILIPKEVDISKVSSSIGGANAILI